MSKMRTLSFLHHGDYISYNNNIYKVDWSLSDNNNVIHVKTNKPFYIKENEKVKWLDNFKKLHLINQPFGNF